MEHFFDDINDIIQTEIICKSRGQIGPTVTVSSNPGEAVYGITYITLLLFLSTLCVMTDPTITFDD